MEMQLSLSAPTGQAEQEAMFNQCWRALLHTEWMLKVVSAAAGGLVPSPQLLGPGLFLILNDKFVS